MAADSRYTPNLRRQHIEARDDEALYYPALALDCILEKCMVGGTLDLQCLERGAAAQRFLLRFSSQGTFRIELKLHKKTKKEMRQDLTRKEM